MELPRTWSGGRMGELCGTKPYLVPALDLEDLIWAIEHSQHALTGPLQKSRVKLTLSST